MATIQWYVDPDATGAGDGTSWTDAYNTRNAFEAAEGADLVTNTDVYIVNCRSSSGTADTSSLTINGFTTSSDYHLDFIGDNTTGIWDDTKYRMEVGGRCIDCQDNFVNFINDQLYRTSGSGVDCLLIRPSGEVGSTIESSILKGDNAATENYGIRTLSSSSGTVNVINSLIYNIGQSASQSVGFYAGAGGATHNILNSTIVHNGRGIRNASGTVNSTNNALFDNADDHFGTITILNCATEQGAGEGTSGVAITQTASDYAALVTDALNSDFSVTDASSELSQAGTNTGAPATDIIGTSRPQGATTDIGAFELVAGTPGVTVDCTLGTLTIAGLDAEISVGTDINTNSGALSIQGFNPQISAEIIIDSTSGSLNISGLNPDISVGIDINVSSGQVNITGLNPEISTEIIVSVNSGALNIAGQNPDVSQGININCNSGSTEISGQNPTVDLGVIIEPNTGLVTITGQNPDISAGTLINVGFGSLSIDGKSVSVSQDINIDCNAGSLNISGFDVDIVSTTEIQAGLGELSINGLNPNIIIGDFVLPPSRRTIIITKENRILNIPIENRTITA